MSTVCPWALDGAGLLGVEIKANHACLQSFRRQISPYLGAGAHAQLAESKKTNKSSKRRLGLFWRALSAWFAAKWRMRRPGAERRTELASTEGRGRSKKRKSSWGYGAMTSKEDSFHQSCMTLKPQQPDSRVDLTTFSTELYIIYM